MGSDDHYAEEKPAHRVKVDGFWIDATPVTNAPVPALRQRHRPRHLRRDRARSEGLSRRAAAYAARWLARLRQVRRARSISRTGRNGGPSASARIGVTLMVRGVRTRASTTIPWCTSPIATPRLTPNGPARSCRPRPNGSSRRAAGSRARNSPGASELMPGGKYMANTWQGEFPWQNLLSDGYETHLAGRHLPAQRLRPLRHDRQCVGMDHGLVFAKAQRGRDEGLLHAAEPARRAARRRATIPASPISRFRAK